MIKCDKCQEIIYIPIFYGNCSDHYIQDARMDLCVKCKKDIEIIYKEFKKIREQEQLAFDTKLIGIFAEMITKFKEKST